MLFSKTTIVSFGLLATSKLVAGHAAIIGATGDQGGQGSAIGVDPATPRDGTRRNPFQQDSTRFRNANADQCGETLGGGDNDVETGTQQVMAMNGATLPQVSAGGEVSMTLHQVNGDGAGPYTCMIDSTGTGTQWTPIQVTQNIDGNARGRNNDQQMQDLPLTAAIPADQQCTGTVAGQSNVCMVRCENPARAGPFGGCVPVQMAGAAAAAPAAAAPAAAAPAANANAGAAAAAAPAAAVPAAAVPAANANAGAVAPAANANAGVAPAANANAGALPAANGAAGNVGAGNVGAAGNVAPAANANAGVAPQAGAATGANTAAGANAGLVQRSAKQLTSTGPVLTDDDQEEEVDLLE